MVGSQPLFKRFFTVAWLAVLAIACGQPIQDIAKQQEDASMTIPNQPTLIANNVFFYYQDLDAASKFYLDTLGLETVADYGFAKILQIAETSYLTLVDAKSGIHSADEPKTVALALITDELAEWYQYLISQNVSMKSSEFAPVEGSPHDGFVVNDPEGYLLEFERFNDHPENERFMPMLNRLESFYPNPKLQTQRPSDLGFKATVLWLYSQDLAVMQEFYESVMGFELIVDQGWAKIHACSPSGFIGPVDGARGMHSWTKEKAVMLSLITADIDSWFSHLQNQPKFKFRKEEIGEEKRAGARVFVGYDPDGYFIELDEFFDAPGNEVFLERLGTRSGL